MSFDKKKRKIMIGKIFVRDYSQTQTSYNYLTRPSFADTLCITSISNLGCTIGVRKV